MLSATPARSGAPQATVSILARPGDESHEFIPLEAFGAAIDGHAEGETAQLFTPHNLAEMRSAGLGALTYRLRTELANEAWHWNPSGRWSDAAHGRGYWTSDDTASSAIEVSFGYRLPRRGNSLDQADNEGFSRLDDGDTLSFWKSSPYLETRFTREPESEHVQWLIADFGHARALDAARILWGAPYARKFRVQYWDARGSEPSDLDPAGRWRDFPRDAPHHGHAGAQQLKLADRPISTRYVRLLLEQSSHSAPAGCSDARDSMGFAIRELEFGALDAAGRIVDCVRHSRSGTRQTRMIVSSTDPWHRQRDRDPDCEQPGLDLLFHRAMTTSPSVLLPVGVLYDTPENAAALLSFAHKRGYSVPRVEIGEEPDGQFVAPEDFAALFTQTAHALKQVDSTVALGGPSFEDAENADLAFWPVRPAARASWMSRFLRSLTLEHSRDDFQFFSFEWYPFANPCPPNEDQVARAPRLLRDATASLRQHDVPTDIPWLISEYGYSVRAARAEVELEGALVNADAVGGFLTAGCERMYLYGYEPGQPMSEPGCEAAGNLMMLLADDAGQARDRLPTYYSAWLLTHAWTVARDQPHRVYAVRVATAPADSNTAPSAFAVLRPDEAWGVMLVNRDARRTWTTQIDLEGSSAARSLLSGPVELWQYSPAQFEWERPGESTRPEKSLPPEHRMLLAPQSLNLPPYSITVMVARP